MDFLRGSPFDGFGVAVIASGGVDAGVAHDLRNRRNVHSTIESIIHQVAAQKTDDWTL